MSDISDKYTALGGAGGFLGAATSAELPNADGIGLHQNFQNGVIYWHRDTGAYEVHGAILQRWSFLGNETSPLGYPMTDETSTPDGVGRFNHFQHGSICWTPGTGAHDVQTYIRERWALLGWDSGWLGYPVTDPISQTRGLADFSISKFQRGRIERNLTTGEIISYHSPSVDFPNYEVPVVALKVRDSDGGRATRIDVPGIQDWVAHANGSYEVVGIRFTYNGQLDLFDDTEVNSLTGIHDPFWLQARDRLNLRAAQQPAVLIVFRWGPDPLPGGGGFSWDDYNFVVMPGHTPQFWLLAHEVGHYFGLWHTAGPGFQTQREATDYFLSRMSDPSVFDNDAKLTDALGRSIVNDTPPDPIIEEVKYDVTRYSVSLAGTPFALPRDNAMSYWEKPFNPSFTPSQINRIRQILAERVARGELNVTEITHPVRVTVVPYPVPLNRQVSLRVTAVDYENGAAVAGTVKIDGTVAATTNTQFRHTFKPKRRVVSTHPRQVEVTYPTGVVSFADYPDAPIDFGFPQP